MHETPGTYSMKSSCQASLVDLYNPHFFFLNSCYSHWHSSHCQKSEWWQILDLVFISSSVDQEGKTNSCTWSAGWTMHAKWGCNEWANWVSLLQKWSGVLVCGTRWKENGRGRPPKNIIQELFCQNECASGGNRKRQREGNRVGSVWARMVWSQGESEREEEKRGTESERVRNQA